MKRTTAAFLSLALITCGHAAAPAPDAAEQQLLALVQQLQTQQQVIAENQTKIEAKLQVIAEGVRIARIYSSRGGAK
ncbi:hypothetical protein BH20VER2_BH20VER2_00860 [soil metagenome]|nr:hypothetical protein [Chthoniobacterales bacterium]